MNLHLTASVFTQLGDYYGLPAALDRSIRYVCGEQDEVVLVGRIGGSEAPFVDGLAAFTIVDAKVPPCSAEEGCETPWDYCCEQDAVKDNIATL